LVYQKHKKTTYEINRKWVFLFSIIYFNKTRTEVATEFSGYMEGAVLSGIKVAKQLTRTLNVN
jgi:hypothetical protein